MRGEGEGRASHLGGCGYLWPAHHMRAHNRARSQQPTGAKEGAGGAGCACACGQRGRAQQAQGEARHKIHRQHRAPRRTPPRACRFDRHTCCTRRGGGAHTTQYGSAGGEARLWRVTHAPGWGRDGPLGSVGGGGGGPAVWGLTSPERILGLESCVWMISFTRSMGAVMVLATAPDTPPARKLMTKSVPALDLAGGAAAAAIVCLGEEGETRRGERTKRGKKKGNSCARGPPPRVANNGHEHADNGKWEKGGGVCMGECRTLGALHRALSLACAGRARTHRSQRPQGTDTAHIVRTKSPAHRPGKNGRTHGKGALRGVTVFTSGSPRKRSSVCQSTHQAGKA